MKLNASTCSGECEWALLFSCLLCHTCGGFSPQGNHQLLSAVFKNILFDFLATMVLKSDFKDIFGIIAE